MTPDGTRAISVSYDQTCKVWDLTSGQGVARFTGESPISCCTVPPNGKTIVVGENSGRVHILCLEGFD